MEGLDILLVTVPPVSNVVTRAGFTETVSNKEGNGFIIGRGYLGNGEWHL